jgi:transposase
MSEQKRNCRRRYDRQFKEDALALVRGGRSLSQVASDLGVTSGMLSEWRKKIEAGEALTEPKTLQALSPEQGEIHRLRQEVDYLRQQRDILKKALGILSAEMPANVSR